MTKVLYIYGYGSTEKSETAKNLQEVLGDDFEIVSFRYNQEDPLRSICYFQDVIATEGIDLVIGSSLGGFFAIASRNYVPIIVINPCLCPSYELPKIGCPSEIAHRYNDAEMMLENFENDEREYCFGFFGTHDELIDYRRTFGIRFGSYAEFNAGHRPTKEELKAIAPIIKEKVNYWNSEECSNKVSMFDSVDGLY